MNRKIRAKVMLELLRTGCSTMSKGDKLYYSEWLEIWIIPQLKELIPELKYRNHNKNTTGEKDE